MLVERFLGTDYQGDSYKVVASYKYHVTYPQRSSGVPAKPSYRTVSGQPGTNTYFADTLGNHGSG